MKLKAQDLLDFAVQPISIRKKCFVIWYRVSWTRLINYVTDRDPVIEVASDG